MAGIRSDVYTVIVTMDCEPDDQDELINVAKQTEGIFARQPGFISSALHRKGDGTRVLQYLQWESKEANDACMASSDWQDGTADAFMAFIHSGKATMDPADYEVVSVQEGS